MEKISKLSKNGRDDVLLDYICENYYEIDCELNGDEYKESKKHNYDFCVACNKERLLDNQKPILVCRKCDLCDYYPVHVTSYNHSMKPLRRKCIYKRLDNFKAILNQFFNGRKQLVPDDVMEAIRSETNNKRNILYNYEISIMISILECILKRNKLTKYKNGIFKINGQPFPYITMREYGMILNVFNIVSSIYDKYKPKGRKSFLNYYLFFF